MSLLEELQEKRRLAIDGRDKLFEEASLYSRRATEQHMRVEDLDKAIAALSPQQSRPEEPVSVAQSWQDMELAPAGEVKTVLLSDAAPTDTDVEMFKISGLTHIVEDGPEKFNAMKHGGTAGIWAAARGLTDVKEDA